MFRAFPLNPSANFRWYWAPSGCSSCAQIAAPDAPTCCRISPEMLDWSAAETNRLALWPDGCKINLRGESKSTKSVKEHFRKGKRKTTVGNFNSSPKWLRLFCMRKSWSTTTDNWLPSSRTFVRRFTSRNSSLSRNLNCKKKNGASTRNNWKMSGAWIGVATQTSLRPKSNSLKSGNKLYNCGLIFFSWQLRHLNTFSSCKVHTQ